jgi:8-oxo-dGTP diphosphatase
VFKTEKQVSAGGIVFREKDSKLEVALISRKNKKNIMVWCLPKGKVEKGESIEETAFREVKEETGLEGELLKKIDAIHYFYSIKEENVRFSKTVDFYLFCYKGGDTRGHDEEVEEVRWFDIEEAVKILSYKSEKETMEKAKKILGDLNLLPK